VAAYAAAVPSPLVTLEYTGPTPPDNNLHVYLLLLHNYRRAEGTKLDHPQEVAAAVGFDTHSMPY
jgi:phosphatidylethanolamine-binding protein (PEBP) family uncharacterized protein